MVTKKEFMRRPKIRSLPVAERERRWIQHQSSGTGRAGNRRITNTRGVRNRGSTSDLQTCTKDYILALENPYGLNRPVCIPDLNSIATKKVRAMARGSFSTGSAGTGYIILNPHMFSNNYVNISTSQYALAAFTNGTVDVTTLETNGNASGVDLVAMSQLPYSTAEFQYDFATGAKGEGVSCRLVGLGVRVRYIGTELNRSGRYVVLRQPDNQGLEGQTLIEMSNYQTATTQAVDREWHSLTYAPALSTDYEFSGNPLTKSDDQNIGITTTTLYHQYTDYPMVIVVTGSAASNAFEYEIVGHYEYSGKVNNVTKSHTDLVGLSAVRNALPYNDAAGSPSKKAQDMYDLAKSYVYNQARGFANSALETHTGLSLDNFDL